MRPNEIVVLGIVTGSVIVPVFESDATAELNVPVPEMVPELVTVPELVIVPELVTVPPEFTVSVNPEGIVSK